MHLSCCEHPVYVYDKELHRKILVPCGKCDVCRNNKSFQWVQRLNQEARCWSYTVFVTLTYSEKYVPQYVFTPDHILWNADTDEYIDPNSVPNFGKKDELWLHKRSVIRSLSVRDVQLFVKRLRYYYDSITQHSQKVDKILRYFICGEYGPTGYRPHYHGLFFFNSKIAASRFEELLSKSWKFGITTWRFDSGNAHSYTAQYVNCVASLPKIYRHKFLRPFALCSKCPPIGSLQFDDEEIFKIFNESITYRTVYDSQKNAVRNVPLPRSVKDSLFPKVQRYRNLTHINRVALYGITQFVESENFFEFKKKINDMFNTWCDTPMPSDWLQTLHGLFDNPSPYPLYNLYCVSKRVVTQSCIFGCTLDYYVRKIEDFYNKIDYEKLLDQLKFQQAFVIKYHDPGYLINLDCHLIDFLAQHGNINSVKSRFAPLVESFGLNYDKFVNNDAYRYYYSLDFCPEFNEMLSKHHKIARDNTKSKKKNDYLRNHPLADYLHDLLI